MLDDINYELIFNESIESIPSNIKGDYKSIHEIKISRDKLYVPKHHIEQTLNVHEQNTDEEEQNKNGNINNLNTTKKNLEENYKYCITNDPNNLINFEDKGDYYTNDQDLKKLIDLFNEPNTKEYGYSNVIDEKNCQVFKRMVEGYPVILIKCLAKMPYNKDVVFEAISNLDIRKQWDSVFSELKVVNHEGENGAEILFMIIKSPVFTLFIVSTILDILLVIGLLLSIESTILVEIEELSGTPSSSSYKIVKCTVPLFKTLVGD